MRVDRRSWLKFAGLVGFDQVASAAPNNFGADSLVATKAVALAETGSGKVHGFVRRGVFTFRGIPYGASTAASADSCRRRWRR